MISRMALHYVEDLDARLAACHDCLRGGGRMVFTVVHPLVTSHDARESGEHARRRRIPLFLRLAGERA